MNMDLFYARKRGGGLVIGGREEDGDDRRRLSLERLVSSLSGDGGD